MRKILWTLLFVTLLLTFGCSKITGSVPTNDPQPSTQSSQLPSVAQDQIVTAFVPQTSFSWIDLKSDILNPKALTTDEKPDGHFHVIIPFIEPTKIKYIIMRYTEFGEHVQWAWEYNTTVPIVGSPMAVFVNGTLVSQGTDKGLPCPIGNTDLDLFISELNNENGRDTFKFESGQNFSVQINYITKPGAEQEFNSTTVVTM